MPIMSKEGPQRAWFSQAAVEAGCGSYVYRRADGSEVEVTNVGPGTGYAWEDKVDLGLVVQYVRPGILPRAAWARDEP